MCPFHLLYRRQSLLRWQLAYWHCIIQDNKKGPDWKTAERHYGIEWWANTAMKFNADKHQKSMHKKNILISRIRSQSYGRFFHRNASPVFSGGKSNATQFTKEQEDGTVFLPGIAKQAWERELESSLLTVA